MALITFDSGTAIDQLRLVGAEPEAIGTSGMLPEMGIALSENQTPLRRAYALGYVRGCLVGMGFESALTLREAETVFYAEPLSYDNLHRRHGRGFDQWDDTRAQAVAQASGVLYGYKSSTTYLPDAWECVACERRVVRGLDDYSQCLDGLFCSDPDCFPNFEHSRDCREDRS